MLSGSVDVDDLSALKGAMLHGGMDEMGIGIGGTNKGLESLGLFGLGLEIEKRRCENND